MCGIVVESCPHFGASELGIRVESTLKAASLTVRENDAADWNPGVADARIPTGHAGCLSDEHLVAGRVPVSRRFFAHPLHQRRPRDDLNTRHTVCGAAALVPPARAQVARRQRRIYTSDRALRVAILSAMVLNSRLQAALRSRAEEPNRLVNRTAASASARCRRHR